MANNEEDKDLFERLKRQLAMYDPVAFCEANLTLDGKPFTLSHNGYRPFSDIYRYIGLKALEPTSLPVIVVKGRQTGMTTAASALEMYFMGSGLFGTDDKPPIRVIHAFPQLEHAAAYSKTKLQQMIVQAKTFDAPKDNKGAKPKSCMQKLLDTSQATNDSLHFKQFQGGNHLWIESTGLDADRIAGRMLALQTELPTPNGYIQLIDLKEGDQLFDEKGNICKITKLHQINYTPKSYKITFDDGTAVDACADHLWLTYTKKDRKNLRKGKDTATVKSTEQILSTLKVCGESNHSIFNCLPLNYEKKDLPLDPYLLGLWLGDGDGNGRIETADPEILAFFDHKIIPSSVNRIGSCFGNLCISKSSSYRVVGLTTALKNLKLLKNTNSDIGNFYNKYIPDIYMKGSFDQRLSLVQGLLDTDGSCDKIGRIEFTQVRQELAQQFYELILSLGIKATIKKDESWRYEKQYKDRYRVSFNTNLPVFRIKRKLNRLKKNIKKSNRRYITNIELIDPIPMRCITVDSPSHLFLITKQCIPTHNTADVILYDEVQKIPALAIGNSLKILTAARYGRPTKGVQVYFGTPRRKGSDYYKMWQQSSQQYYHLGCAQCEKHFPLYTPGSDDWQQIWIHGFTVRCVHCGHEQDKRQAAERGKWIPLKDINDEDCKMIGFHINQLYMPLFTREDIINEMPGVHPINTERTFQNEVLGEFYQGDSSPITPEEIKEICGDVGRKFRGNIELNRDENKNQLVVMGIDYGARNDMEQMANPDAKAAGQSYSTAVILAVKGPGLLSIEFCTKFKRNDSESKKALIDQLMRQYSVHLAVGDIGFSHDFSTMLHNAYGDKYLVSRAHPKVNGKVKFSTDAFPKEIVFERDCYIGELYEQMKKGMIRFPFGDYEKIAWLIEHCASMEIKPTISKHGDPSLHYVKGGTPNDGFMALLNAYIAYKFLLTKGFTNFNPNLQQEIGTNKPMIVAGYCPRRF